MGFFIEAKYEVLIISLIFTALVCGVFVLIAYTREKIMLYKCSKGNHVLELFDQKLGCYKIEKCACGKKSWRTIYDH